MSFLQVSFLFHVHQIGPGALRRVGGIELVNIVIICNNNCKVLISVYLTNGD